MFNLAVLVGGDENFKFWENHGNFQHFYFKTGVLRICGRKIKSIFFQQVRLKRDVESLKLVDCFPQKIPQFVNKKAGKNPVTAR